MKLTIEEKAQIFGLKVAYYKRCKKRKEYEAFLDSILKIFKEKLIKSLE